MKLDQTIYEPDRISLGKNITVDEGSGDSKVLTLNGADGHGVMTLWKVFDGVYLMFNNFFMAGCESCLKVDAPVLCIDHCREGKIEQKSGGRTFSYLKAGDLRIDNRKKHGNNFSMPLSHYRGITIAFILGKADNSLPCEFHGFPVKLRDLYAKFCKTSHPFVIRDEPVIEHIFSELYTVPEKIKHFYFKIKIFELLLFLDALEISNHDQSQPYFYRAQVEKIRAIHNLMTRDIRRHYLLEELSRAFDIALTPMKNCFKAVFGSSIYAYMRSYRMNRAAVMLRRTDRSVMYIAGEVGYSSPSKFAAAFKAVMKMSPRAYRKFPGQMVQNSLSGAETPDAY